MNQVTTIFKLLSDETRLRMLMLLYQEDLCVCELSGILGVPQPRISQNLAKFRDVEMVTDLRKDKYVYYSLKRNNQTLMNILADIMKEIGLHPKLMEDQKGLEEKENYLKNCGNKCC